ncbi:ShlB/FhaC/HecB family hemolysin secretion/activation protein [Haloferula sp.]|uniref:ShlB/FhaC/HecB family hemolysin secretion/activation protein n=1 Tax=Haloferula sp. TaxID=2497595 RepID=UPI00329E3292
MKKLGGIVLESWSDEAIADIAEGLSASQDLLVPSPETLSKKLEGWIGRPLTEGDLVALADVILIHYDVEGYPVVGLEVPDQDFRDGKLHLLAEIGRIGRVGVSRPKYGDVDSLRDGLWLRGGDLLRRRDLDEQLSWFGRSIFRNPRLFVSPGEEPATADILIAMEERKPWRVTMGYENSGPDVLGRDRFLFGAVGMTKSEQLIAWQSVFGAPVSSLQAHALHWEIPFHRLHQSLILDAGYAEVSSLGLSPNGFGGFTLVDNDGTSWSLAAGQRFHFSAPSGWRQHLTAGMEVKGTDQFVLFGAVRVAPGEVRLVHAKVAYDLSKTWDDGGATLNASLIASPGGLINGNDDADFQAYDPQADSNYRIARVSGSGWWSPGGDWRLLARGSGQWADSRLLPAEQFAVGGAQTVRGASEREFFADNGWQASFEAYTPSWMPVDNCQMRFLGFFDCAWIKNRGRSSRSLSSTGLGIRMNVTEHFNLRADHGWRLDDSENQSHVGFTVTF